MFRVYYEELDGDLHPQRVLIQPHIQYEISRHELNAPFERFYDEDFHDDLKVLTITQASLARDSFNDTVFHINIEQVKAELYSTGLNPEHVYSADYLLFMMSDLEEIMQMELRHLFTEYK